MNGEQARELVQKYIDGKASPHEITLLENWYYQESKNNPLAEQDLLFLLQKEIIWKGTLHRAGLVVPRRSKHFKWIPYAAAAVLLCISLIAVYLYQPNHMDSGPEQLSLEEFAPGGNRATIVFSDGDAVELREDQEEIRLGAQGILYGDGTVASPKESRTLTVKTPKGGQYKLVLPDGSQVWLNADSELTYTEDFGRETRQLSLLGEAYFDVAKNESKPFIVRTSQMDVKVVGTQFNVNAYDDEPSVKTTLVGGSVQLDNRAGNFVLMQPGQQAYAIDGGFRVLSADVQSAIAWKDGYFMFEHAPLHMIVRQLSRWYSISVDYQTIPNLHFTGGISRDVPLSQVVEMLEKSGKIKLGLENNQLIGR